MYNKVISWVEANSASDETITRISEGAIQWQSVTDTVIVTTRHDRDYKKIYNYLKNTINIIPGLKGSTIFENGKDLDDLHKWEELSKHITEINNVVPHKYFAFEFEGAFGPFAQSKVSCDLEALTECVKVLPTNVTYLIHPSITSGDRNTRQNQLKLMMALCDGLLNSNFRLIEWAYGWNKHFVRVPQPATDMINCLCRHYGILEKFILMYTYGNETLNWAWEYSRVTEFMARVQIELGPNNIVVFYPGYKYWTESDKIVEQLKLIK